MADELVEGGSAAPFNQTAALLQKEAVQIRLDVHVHLNAQPFADLGASSTRGVEEGGRSFAGHAPAGGDRPRKFLASTALAIACVLGGVFVYRASTGPINHTAGPSERSASLVQAQPEAVYPSQPSAAALPKELQEPPVVTPAPGAPSPGAPAGPAVFGLN